MQTTESMPQTTNGIDVAKMRQTMEALQDEPGLGEFQFRARGGWLDGGHNRTTISGFYGAGEEHKRDEPFVFDKDEPPVLLGKDNGANPVEYLLAGLAGCATTSMAYHAAAEGVEIESIESELEGDIDLRGFLGLSSEVPKGYQGIRLKFKVKSDADEAALRRYAGMSPVVDTVSRPVPISIEIEKV